MADRLRVWPDRTPMVVVGEDVQKVAVDVNGKEGIFTCNVVNALRLHQRLGPRVRLVGLVQASSLDRSPGER
jgi:cytochrome c-type biogenesis protein CcmE